MFSYDLLIGLLYKELAVFWSVYKLFLDFCYVIINDYAVVVFWLPSMATDDL
jgi:hypothetical protein